MMTNQPGNPSPFDDHGNLRGDPPGAKRKLVIKGVEVTLETDYSFDMRGAALAGALKMLENDKWLKIIQEFRPDLTLYLTDRMETGGFLRAVLENDFAGALARAHPSLVADQFRALALLLNTGLPQEAWGSPENVAKWLEKDTAKLEKDTAKKDTAKKDTAKKDAAKKDAAKKDAAKKDAAKKDAANSEGSEQSGNESEQSGEEAKSGEEAANA